MRKSLLWALALTVLLAASASFGQQPSNPDQQPPAAQEPRPVPVNPAPVEAMRRVPPPLSEATVKTYHLKNISQPTQIQDVVNMLRTILEFTRVQPLAAERAIVVRGTPEQITHADRLVAELDRTGVAGREGAKETASYKLDFTLTEFENGRKANTRSYSMMLERGATAREAEAGQFRVGSRVPIVTGAKDGAPLVQYMDIGVNIDSRLWGSDDDLTLASNIELSGISAPSGGGPSQPVVRQTRSNLRAAIAAGKPTVIASIDEVDSPRRLEIAVTATKVK